MQRYLCILLFLVIPGLSSCDTRLYIGEEKGKLLAGIETTLAVDGFSVRFNVDSLDLRHGNIIRWSPCKVRYGAEVMINNLVYRHECLHAVDQQEYYGKKAVVDELYFRHRF